MLKLFVIIRLAADIYTHMHKYKGKQIQTCKQVRFSLKSYSGKKFGLEELQANEIDVRI